MVNLQQDADGFIRMNKHFPRSASVSITFTDGTSEQLSGTAINTIYDDAVTAYRATNRLDAKGFSRRPAKTVPAGNHIEFVPVHPGIGK